MDVVGEVEIGVEQSKGAVEEPKYLRRAPVVNSSAGACLA